jgi:hypothetical protein
VVKPLLGIKQTGLAIDPYRSVFDDGIIPPFAPLVKAAQTPVQRGKRPKKDPNI